MRPSAARPRMDPKSARSFDGSVMTASTGPWVAMKKIGWVTRLSRYSQSVLTGQSGLGVENARAGKENVITDVIRWGSALAVRTAPVAPWEWPAAATA